MLLHSSYLRARASNNTIHTGTLQSRTRAAQAEQKTADALRSIDDAREGIMKEYLEAKVAARKDEVKAHRAIKDLKTEYDEQVIPWHKGGTPTSHT